MVEGYQRLNHERALQLLKENIASVLAAFDEPLAVVVTVVWQPSLGKDLPMGTVLTRSERDVTSRTLQQCATQNARMGEYIAAQLKQKVASMERTIREQEERIRSLQTKENNETEAPRPAQSRVDTATDS